MVDFPDDFKGHWETEANHPWVRIERHTEFVSITQTVSSGHDPWDVLDKAWIDESPEDILVLTELRSGIDLELPDHYDAISDMRDGVVTTAVRFEPDENGLSAWWVSFADDPGESLQADSCRWS